MEFHSARCFRFILSFLIILWIVDLVLPVSAVLPGTETRLSYSSAAGCSNLWPSGDKGWVVWEETCPDQSRIIAYNYTTAVQLTLPNATLSAHSPKMRDNRVVWYETDNGELSNIYYTDLDTVGQNDVSLTAHILPIPITEKSHPAVDDNFVVWQEGDATHDIMLYNIATSQVQNLTPATDGSDQQYPAIAGGRVVWQDNIDGGWAINYTDTLGSIYHSIPDPSTGDVNYNHPAIDQDSIVWYGQDSTDSLYDLFIFDLNTDTASTLVEDSDNTIFGPSVCSTYVAWKEDMWGDGGFIDVILYNRDTSVKEIITDNSTPTAGIDNDADRSPVLILPDSRIIWVDIRQGLPNIYMYTYGPDEDCPIVQFSADKTEGTAPMTVRFTDNSQRSPTIWRWDFGDGTYASGNIVDHKYTSNGKYNVRLTAATPYCRSTTPYSEATVISVGVPDVDFSVNVTVGLAPLPVAFTGTATNSPDSWLWSFGDGETSNLQNPIHWYNGGKHSVILKASNTMGEGSKTRSDYITALNGTQVTGIITDTLFQSGDIIPKNFSANVGNNLPINFHFTTDSRDFGKSLKTLIWESEAPSDDSDFYHIISDSHYSDKNVAYTLTFIRSDISAPSSMILNFSINSKWETGSGNIATERTKTFVIAHGYNSNGDEVGIILPTSFVGNDTVNHIEFFTVDVPSQYTYLNKFALTKLSGSGNPFQLITLTIASQANAPAPSGGSDSYSGAPSGSNKGLSAQAPQPAPEQKAPVVFIDPGKTAPLYSNQGGVITQETTLTSTDTLASVVLGEGTIAKDSTGSPLSSVSIASLAPDAIPAAPPSGQAVMIDGRAYELGPDGATFSPGITVTFTIPQAQWGKEYSLMMYDKAAGTWSEVPGSFNAKDGTFTAVLSHFCCVALFEKNLGQPTVRQTTGTPKPEPARLAPVVTPTPQPPQNALSIVFSMAEWVFGEAANRSSYLTALAIIIIIVLSIMLLHRRRNNP